MMKAVAEGLQEPFGHKEEGLVVGDGWFELVGDAVVILSSVEFEEAMMFPVGDIVELGEFFAEAFGEALAWEFGKVGEGLETPELEDWGVRKREGFGEGEIGELECEGFSLVWAKGGEVSKIGCFAETDLERESEVAGGGEGLCDPVGFRGHEEGGKIEKIGLGCGDFKIWDEGIYEGEGFATGGIFGSKIRIK
jgi:hypothetical protein